MFLRFSIHFTFSTFLFALYNAFSIEIEIMVDPKMKTLTEKGLNIPGPDTVYIAPEVKLENISKDNVTIYPGCRILGEKTLISSGVKLGQESPATIENCLLADNVKLKGGHFKGSLFLDNASLGMGAHIREGCILEEQTSGAHCVGLKQTILMPFVTLGSLINLCDCLVAGGTSRNDHTEIGSSYIHFNFTPEGDKATPSLIGDVPKGVMLNQPRIFLGGQGGIVGPARVAFGTVASAGSIIRSDIVEDNKFVSSTNRDFVKDFALGSYRGIKRTFVTISTTWQTLLL